MKNSIAERVFDFLKKYPPFDMLDSKNLIQISSEVTIIYLDKGNSIFKKGDSAHEYFYIVRDGAVYLYHEKENDKEQHIAGINDVGDIFGLRPLMSQENYQLTATANEESILYGIPINLFQLLTEQNVKINKFLITSFASNTYDPYTSEENVKIFVDYLPNNPQDIVNFQTANYTKNPITCSYTSSVKDAAIKMSTHKIGCIVVLDDMEHPIGVITNSDLKNKIATGLFPIETSVTEIMSVPVITENKKLTVADGQLKMIKNNIGHLCITVDGTTNSKLIGILTHHDVLVSLGNNPSVILKEIKRSTRTKNLRLVRRKANSLLKSYLEQNIPLSHILKIISNINEAITVRAIEIALMKFPLKPPVTFAWLTLGSQGRKEQLLFTDQDSALIFDDVPENKYEETQDYFIKLAQLVTKSLNKIGFEYCEADMMASNREWCKSISEWKKQFGTWILKPDEKAILLSSIFFDYNYTYGNIKLVEELTESIFNTLDNSSLLYKFLANDAVKSPSPLGFFKKFVVEQNGEHKDLFNIKSRALLPLIDAARLLILSHKVSTINNTYERYEKLAELEPQYKELFDSCAYAFKALLKFKTKQGILNNNSGKFIELATLTKDEQLKLKRCFKPINEIQELLKIRFDTKSIL